MGGGLFLDKRKQKEGLYCIHLIALFISIFHNLSLFSKPIKVFLKDQTDFVPQKFSLNFIAVIQPDNLLLVIPKG